MPKEGKQYSFYINEDGTEMRPRYKKRGDQGFKPKEKKKKKESHRRSGPTPFQEVIHYVKALRAFQDNVGIWQITDIDGNVTIRNNPDSMLRITDEEGGLSDLPEQWERLSGPKRPQLDDLSPKARSLYYKFRREGKI